MTLSRFDALVLNALPEPGAGLRAYTIISRYRIQAGVLASVVARLKKLKLAEVDGDQIFVTSLGAEYRIEHRQAFRRDQSQPWKEIPNKFSIPRLPVSVPYVPRRSLLDKKLR